MKTQWSLLIPLAAAVVGVGCGNAGPQKLDESYMKNGEQIGRQRRDVFLRAGGDYAKMSEADRRTYLESFKGDEAAAKGFWDIMKSPPTSAGPPNRGPGRP